VSGESYTIKELSRISGYSINTIRGYIKSTKIKAQLVNGKYQIDQAEAERFFKVGNQAGNISTTKIDTNLITELIPLILRINNDNNRIKRAKKGEATVKRLFESSNELENYDQKHDIRIEYSHLIGDVIGLLLGSIYFLS